MARVILHRTNEKPTDRRVVDKPDYEVRRGDELLGWVTGRTVRESRHYSARSVRIWYGRRVGSGERLESFASKQDARDYVARS